LPPSRSVLGAALSSRQTAIWLPYRDWQWRIGPHDGAVGQHGSIAVIERFIKTLKHEGLRGLLVPFRRELMRAELLRVTGWYNEHRPHMTLKGRTPDEVYFQRFPDNRRPRIEPRESWPRGSPCAKPHALVAGKRGATFTLDVTFVDGRSNLPIVKLRRAA
jgi:Integrase core domain